MISRLPQLQKSTEPWCAEENLQQISGEFQACHDIFLFMSTCIQPAGFSGGLDWIFGIPLGVSLGVIPKPPGPLTIRWNDAYQFQGGQLQCTD